MSKICITQQISQEQTKQEQIQQDQTTIPKETDTQPDFQQDTETQQLQDDDRKLHKEKFTHFVISKYLTKQTTSCATSLKAGQLLLDIITNNQSPQIEQLSKPQISKLKSKIKIRNFCLMLNGSTTVLGQKVESRQRSENNKLISLVPAVFVVKEVAIIENFYDILYTIHNNMVAHSGENKTEYQIDLRYACFPTAVIDEYIKLCPICNFKKN